MLRDLSLILGFLLGGLTLDNASQQITSTATQGAGFGSLLYSATAESTAVINTTTETTLDTKVTIPANFLVAGRIIRVKAYGHYSSDTSAPTLTLRLKYGSTTVAATGALTVGISASSTPWSCEAILTCRIAGASGTAHGHIVGTVETVSLQHVTSQGRAAPTTIDTTANTVVGISVQWGTAHTSNTIRAEQITIEALN